MTCVFIIFTIAADSLDFDYLLLLRMISGGGTFYPGRRSLANSQNAGAEDSSALALTQKLDLIVTSLEENKAMFVGLKNDMATMQCDLANMKEKMDDLVKEETDRKSVVKPVRRKLPNELSVSQCKFWLLAFLFKGSCEGIA